MAILMQLVIAIVTTINTVGYSDISIFYTSWLNAFITSFPLGLCIALLMTTFIKPRLVTYVKGCEG